MNLGSNKKSSENRMIVIDSIDGAGKTTAIAAMQKFLEEKGLQSFDVPDFERTHGKLPQANDPAVESSDFLLVAEPTYSGIGRIIREEIVRNHDNRSYNGKSAMQAFALDREVLYKSLVLPFLQQEEGRWVIQDRGLISSLAYQPLQDPQVNIQDILELAGNQLEISCAPDILFLLTVAPQIAEKRLTGRTEKKDDHIFEQTDFQQKLAARYRLTEVQKPYRDAKTRIIEIDSSKLPETVAQELTDHLKPLLERKSS